MVEPSPSRLASSQTSYGDDVLLQQFAETYASPESRLSPSAVNESPSLEIKRRRKRSSESPEKSLTNLGPKRILPNATGKSLAGEQRQIDASSALSYKVESKPFDILGGSRSAAEARSALGPEISFDARNAGKEAAEKQKFQLPVVRLSHTFTSKKPGAQTRAESIKLALAANEADSATKTQLHGPSIENDPVETLRKAKPAAAIPENEMQVKAARSGSPSIPLPLLPAQPHYAPIFAPKSTDAPPVSVKKTEDESDSKVQWPPSKFFSDDLRREQEAADRRDEKAGKIAKGKEKSKSLMGKIVIKRNDEEQFSGRSTQEALAFNEQGETNRKKREITSATTTSDQVAMTHGQVTKHLLETLKDSHNPITHSDLYTRTAHVVSAASGHQQSNRAGGTRHTITDANYFTVRAAKLAEQSRAAKDDFTDKEGAIGYGGKFAAELHRDGQDVKLQSRIFAGLDFYLNGYSGPRIGDMELKKLISVHGGNVKQLPTSTVTHILITSNLSAKKAQKFIESSASMRGKKKKVVHVDCECPIWAVTGAPMEALKSQEYSRGSGLSRSWQTSLGD